MATEPESTIKEFFEAWSRLNVDHIMDFFTDDAVFHNIPLEPAAGKDEADTLSLSRRLIALCR